MSSARREESLAEPVDDAPATDGRTHVSTGATEQPAGDQERETGPTSSDVSRRSRLVPWVISVALFLGTGALSLLLRTTIHPGDARSYLVKNAASFPDSTWNAAGYSRYGITLLVLPFEKLWGVSQASEYAVPVLCAAWLAVVVYLIGRRMWNDVAGVAAAVLVVINPVFFITATRIYPDSVSAPILATTFLLILVVGDEARRPTVRRGRVTWLLVLIGFLVGWSWGVREISVAVWPVFAWMLLRRVRLRRALLPVALPALAWLVAEMVINQIGHHDPFARFKILTGTYAAGGGLPHGANLTTHTRRAYLMYVPHAWKERPELTWLLALAAVAVIGAIVYFRTMAYLTAWTALAAGLQLAAGGVLRPTDISMRLDIERYWIAFLLPMTLLAVGTVAQTVMLLTRRRRSRDTDAVADHVADHGADHVADGEAGRRPAARPAGRRSGPVGVLASVVVFALLLVVPVHAFAAWSQREWQLAPRGEAGLEQLRTYLSSHITAQDRLWATPYQLKMLTFYQPGPFGGAPEWRAQLETLPKTGDVAPAPGDYVLRIPRNGCQLCNEGLKRWTPGANDRTDGWTLVWQSDHGQIRLYQDR